MQYIIQRNPVLLVNRKTCKKILGGEGREETCRKWDGKGLGRVRKTRVEQRRDGELEGQYRCTHDGIVARLKVHARRTGLMTNPVLETVSKSIRVR